MSHRNSVWTQQLSNPESEQGPVQVQPQGVYYGGTVSDPIPNNLAVPVSVGVPGDLRHYYESSHEHQQPPPVGVTASFAFPTAMYSPGMSTTAVNMYVPQTQSFGLGNPLPYQVAGTMDESSSRCSFGDSASGFIKRKNAVAAGNHHFLHGFASSSSSAHAPQNPAHGPWNTSFQSNCLPSSAASHPPQYHSNNGWSFLEAPADASNSFNSMVAHHELVRHGNYLFPTGDISQCNAWIAQAANGISHGVPQWGYNNAVTNPPGATGMPNGNLQGYQAGYSIHGPLPHFSQNPLHSMQLQAPQMQLPHQQVLSNNLVHGVPSATGLPLDPRMLVLPLNMEHAFGHPLHPPPINQVNSAVFRTPPYQNVVVMNRSRIDEVGLVDDHRDMRLDVDNMSYEELVALEEQIGNVNTGLTESYIQENLRSSFYVPAAACMSDQSSELSVENDACIICQEEYEAKERIGILECGHKYHVMCIKQWLMMKNLCPICKTTALPADRRNE